MRYENNTLVLLKMYMSNEEMLNMDFKSSFLESVSINNCDIECKSYIHLLQEIYKVIGADVVINMTTLNVTREKKTNKGFIWNESLQLSIQRADSNRIIREILKYTEKNLNLKMRIKLNNETYINYSSQ